jgi:hypothetical protein
MTYCVKSLILNKLLQYERDERDERNKKYERNENQRYERIEKYKYMINKSTNFSEIEINYLYCLYKEYKMTLERFISFINHDQINFIVKTNLLYIFFDYFNIEKNKIINLYYFICGFSVLTNKCILVKTEDIMFDILSKNNIISINYVMNNIFNNIFNIYTELLIYYINKWDINNKGYITKDDYNKGIYNMNINNKIILLKLFNGYKII